MKEFSITGMSCAACSARIENAVGKVEGANNVSVNLLTNSMTVDGSADSDEIINAVVNAGYGASLKSNAVNLDKKDELKDKETPILIRRLISSVIFLIPLMYVSMGHVMWGWPLPNFFNENYLGIALFELLITGIIMVINKKFFVSGFKGIIHRSPNMDTLVALGSGSAFIYSTVLVFLMTEQYKNGDMQTAAHYLHDMYFESAAMILTLITVGKSLEAYSKGKTTNALKSLMSLAPDTANVIKNGKTITVRTDEVKKGDIFEVRAGEKIPVDGIIINGESAVDESALTGESIPVDKFAGDKVSAGTINKSGYIECEAVSVGVDTAISKIIKMVEEASSSKAPIAKIADKVSGVFVPVVIIISFITLIVWLAVGQSIGFSLARAISVLVISCPCALGLATPVAIMVGSGKGAKNGILFKNAQSLEIAGKTEIVCLDKTGTITVGTPSVTDIVSKNKDTLLKYAYAVESKSEHPLSKAIVDYCSAKDIMLFCADNVISVPGNGIFADVMNERIYAGNEKYIEKISKIPHDYIESATILSKEGKTPLFFASGSEFLGIIAVADIVKEESKQALKQMEKMGLNVVMITGDNEGTASAIANEVGIENVIAGVLPDGKDEAVAKLSSFGRVAMVGDGINDAPALTRADTGIAIGAGTDVAIESADIVLMRSNPVDISRAIILSKKVILNIKENLFWAFIYNIIGIPIAAGVLYPLGIVLNPMIAAAAMSLSSFCVVTNALRLNLISIDKIPARAIKRKEIDMSILKNDKKPYIVVEGMMCEHCEKHLTEGLAKIGVEIKADHKNNKAEIISGNASDDELRSAVTEAGYQFIEVVR